MYTDASFSEIFYEKTIELFYDNFEVYCNLCFSTKFEKKKKNNYGLVQIGASIEYLSALIDKTYTLSPLVNIDGYQEKIEDGLDYAKNSKRNERIVTEMVKSKIAELDHWTDKQETKATIDNLIRDTLWAELPECYDELSISGYRQRIYEYVYTRYKVAA